MKFNHYMMPSYPEIKEMGYTPQYIDPKISTELFKMLIMIGSPFAKYAQWYMGKYGNVLELSSKAISIYAYGIDNLQQFGREEKEVAYHSLKQCTNTIMFRYNKYSGQKAVTYIKYNQKFVEQAISVLIDILDKEAREQILRTKGNVIPYWFEKKKRIAKKMRVPVCRGGSYRIEKYADMYE